MYIITKLISELGVGHHGLLRLWHTKIEHPNALVSCGQRPSHSLYIDVRASMPRHPGTNYFMSKSFFEDFNSKHVLIAISRILKPRKEFYIEKNPVCLEKKVPFEVQC